MYGDAEHLGFVIFVTGPPVQTRGCNPLSQRARGGPLANAARAGRTGDHACYLRHRRSSPDKGLQPLVSTRESALPDESSTRPSPSG